MNHSTSWPFQTRCSRNQATNVERSSAEKQGSSSRSPFGGWYSTHTTVVRIKKKGAVVLKSKRKGRIVQERGSFNSIRFSPHWRTRSEQGDASDGEQRAKQIEMARNSALLQWGNIWAPRAICPVISPRHFRFPRHLCEHTQLNPARRHKYLRNPFDYDQIPRVLLFGPVCSMVCFLRLSAEYNRVCGGSNYECMRMRMLIQRYVVMVKSG